MYYVYILRCVDGSYYTGITNNLEKRIQMHNQGRGSKYVRSRLPAELVYFLKCSSKSEALKMELQIKKLPRYRKSNLIENSR
nr:GIY-YIG nuclease family protein [Desulfolucanica intricata]